MEAGSETEAGGVVCLGVPTGTNARPGWCLADPDTDTQSPKKPEEVGCTNLAGQLPRLPNEELCRAQNVQPGRRRCRDRPVEHRRGPRRPWTALLSPSGSGAARAERMLAPLAMPAGLGAGAGPALSSQITSVFPYLMQY